MKLYLAAFVVSLLYGGLAYMVLDSWIWALIVFGTYALASSFIIVPVVRAYQERIARHHQAYRFINNYIVSLSVTNSQETAYEAAIEGVNDNAFQEVIKRIETLTVTERIEYLDSFFAVPFYGMFLSIHSIYADQGGDCLAVADPLLKEITRDEEYTTSTHKESQKLLIQFALFWVMSGVIMGFLRFGLSGYYQLMLESVAFRLIAAGYFLIVLASFILFARIYTGLKLFGRERHDRK